MTIVAGVERIDRESNAVIEGRNHAEAFGEDLHVVHVLSQSAFRDLEQDSLSDTGKTVPVDDVRAYAKETAESVASRTTDDYEAVGLVGDAGEEIVRYANEQDASYICVGSRRRSAVGKALFGSVTQDVLLNAECPVVTHVRPDREE
ncbi:universal stress protein [Halorubrum amylolyticum]|uniref:universal stress protein n=1 Tax=Halorubrum amylolyticum TaxID=2508724 RepID=UPI00100885B2|nr:universal stress protein [Halorubrum amylolyticum]